MFVSLSEGRNIKTNTIGKLICYYYAINNVTNICNICPIVAIVILTARLGNLTKSASNMQRSLPAIALKRTQNVFPERKLLRFNITTRWILYDWLGHFQSYHYFHQFVRQMITPQFFTFSAMHYLHFPNNFFSWWNCKFSFLLLPPEKKVVVWERVFSIHQLVHQMLRHLFSSYLQHQRGILKAKLNKWF